MGRRTKFDDVVVQRTDHSLEAKKGQLDREYSDGVEAGKIEGVVRDTKHETRTATVAAADAGLLPEGSRIVSRDLRSGLVTYSIERDAAARAGVATRLPSTQNDSNARWNNELEVIRQCVKIGPPAARVREAGGELGRAYERRQLGTSHIASSSRAFEPSLGSDHYRHAWAAWMTLSWPERELLTLMYALLDSFPLDGGAERIAKVVGGLARGGKEAEAELAVPIWARGTSDEGFVPGLQPHQVRAEVLLAIRLARSRYVAGERETELATAWPDAKSVVDDVRAARAKLRKALLQYELDASGESLLTGKRGVAGIKPLLIPPPTTKEIERDKPPPAPHVVCLGAPIVGGVREACTTEVLAEDISSWARCEYCKQPRKS